MSFAAVFSLLPLLKQVQGDAQDGVLPYIVVTRRAFHRIVPRLARDRASAVSLAHH